MPASPSSMIRHLSQKLTTAGTARPRFRAGCGCSALSRTMALSSSGQRRSPGELCCGNERFHFCEVLAASVGPIGSGLRIDPGRADSSDRRGDIVGTEPAGEYHRDADLVDDAAAEAPIMGTAECPELPSLE